MALCIVREWDASLLEINNAGQDMFQVNHIFEPEFHQKNTLMRVRLLKIQLHRFKWEMLHFLRVR